VRRYIFAHVIAPRTIPPQYLAWNRKWGAPYGHRTFVRRALRAIPIVGRALRNSPRVLGPFGFQPNNDTRHFEYPWAVDVADLRAGQRALDIGGSVAGLQFVLDRMGLEVHNAIRARPRTALAGA
jgi:hypothetical protein